MCVCGYVCLWLFLQTGSTALFFAAQQGHDDIVKLLFEFGASTEFQTKVFKLNVFKVQLDYKHVTVYGPKFGAFKVISNLNHSVNEYR